MVQEVEWRTHESGASILMVASRNNFSMTLLHKSIDLPGELLVCRCDIFQRCLLVLAILYSSVSDSPIHWTAGQARGLSANKAVSPFAMPHPPTLSMNIHMLRLSREQCLMILDNISSFD